MAKKSLEMMEKRQKERDARETYWKTALKSPMGRFRAWMDMIFSDHGFLRMMYLNRHQLGTTGWRSAQPAPYQIRWFRDQGVKTVVSLRGGEEFGAFPLEVEACDKLGLEFQKIVLHSRGLPEPERLLEVLEEIRSLETPVLYHCKSGADRAGLASVLHMYAVEGRPMQEAFEQLSAKFGHFKSAKTGILDAMIETYLAAQEKSGIGFEEWVATEYDPAAIRESFKPVGVYAALVDKILRRE